MTKLSSAAKVIFAFTLGAATGSLVAWRILKTKYERLAQEEIDSVKETYARVRNKISLDETDKKEESKKDDSLTEEENAYFGELHSLLGNYKSDNGEEEELDVRKPRVISPEEYDTVDGYKAVSLTYYSDGIITDDQDEIIKNPEKIIGENIADHFGEYEGGDDSVFVRNDKTKCDYEILRDLQTYAEAMSMCTDPDDAEE